MALAWRSTNGTCESTCGMMGKSQGAGVEEVGAVGAVGTGSVGVVGDVVAG